LKMIQLKKLKKFLKKQVCENLWNPYNPFRC